MNVNNKLILFYLLSFFEGGMMLVTELASTRKISVFFGSSLYVWLVVLCITMIGLAIGYYWANWYIQKKLDAKTLNEKIIAALLVILAVSLIAWKFNSNIALIFIQSNFSLITSVVLDALFLLMIPMFIYGALTTFIIHFSQNISSQPVYGKILAISTIGSVLFAVVSVLLGFPYAGVQVTMNIVSLLALLLALLFRYFNIWWSVAFILFFIYPEKKIRGNILYQNDGAFSSVMVIEENRTRYLLVNYIIQTFQDFANNKTLNYATVIDSVLQSHQIKNKKILILGLGGGVIANKLSAYNNDITGVEIDPRIIECAKKYFNLNKKVKPVCEDAQWFIQTSKEKYDIIIMDMFNGEEPPSYLLTQENFNALKKLLKNDSALLIINWYGYYSGNTGKGTRILIHTLKRTHYYTSCIPTSDNESNSNLVIFASLHSSMLPKSNVYIDTENDINTADKNILHHLNADANYRWRKDYLKFIQHWW